MLLKNLLRRGSYFFAGLHKASNMSAISANPYMKSRLNLYVVRNHVEALYR